MRRTAEEEGSSVMVGEVDTPSGDINVFWGDDLKEKDGNLRVMYNNVDGLKIKDFLKAKMKEKYDRKSKKMLKAPKTSQKLTGILATLRNWDANILCLSETQTAWENYIVRDKVEAELRSMDKNARLIGSSSCAACSEVYKPGGTLTVYDGNWASRISRGTDPHKLGRWSYVTIEGRNFSSLTIITGYRVCRGQNNLNTGSNTSYMQQERILKHRGIKTSPQSMFIEDIENFILMKIELGHEILLNLDANEEWEGEKSKIREMALRLDLHDIAKERNPNGVPPTYTRMNSATRIDFMLGSVGVLNNTMAFGMAPEIYGNTLGNHRAQYIDINILNLLELNIHDIGAPASRRLRSSDPKCIEKYIEKLKENLLHHKVFERMENLWVDIANQVVLNQEQVETYEAIDRDVFRLCVNAEKNIKMHKNMKYVWSPALDNAAKDVQYWQARKKFFNEDLKTKLLVRNGNENGRVDDVKLPYNQIENEIKQAYHTLHQVQKKDVEKRQEFLNNLAEKYALDNKISKELAIRELMEHEELRELFRTIRLKMKGSRSPQLSEIWLKNENEEKIILSESKEVEEHLLSRNWKCLRQAANTPFAEGELGELINWDGTGEFATKIVEGKPLPEIQHMNDVVQKYIQGMSISDPNILNSVDTDITLEQYRDFWYKKRESTATSPYGLHIGHYRSVLHKQYTDILELHHRLMMIPFKFSMIPNRWNQTVQILLEKDTGKPWTNRLRIIELFDSQVNAGLQMIFGKRMVANALKLGELHPSAYGSVPQRTAQDAVMEKTISLDIMRVTKTTGAIFDCDAKGCYDRIVSSLQTISSRRLGVPRTTAIFFARFWRFCRHFVKTRHGTSRNSYMSSGTEILYGIGQGNGAGPAFWLSNLVVMFWVLDSMCHGMQFKSPLSSVFHKSTGLGYVDDVTLGTTTKNGSSINNDDIIENTKREEVEVHKDISTMGKSWETMLHTNGGLLELKKCYWILITWKWKRGVAQLKKSNEDSMQMKIIQTEDNREVIIIRKDVKDAPRVLGCYVAADGSWSKEFGRWRTEAARFAKKVKDAKFSRSCGDKVYKSIWLAKLRYIASVVCFSKSQSETINKKVVTSCLSAAGYNRRFPRKVVYGPIRFGGMGWETCHSLQVLEKIKFFITHVRRQDKIGKLIEILVDMIQLQSGLTQPVLATKIDWTQWVESTWLHNLKEGLDQIDGALHTTFAEIILPRQYDRSLMEIFASWKLSKNELQSINRCRIYIQVMFVSDITNFNGDKINSKAFNVVKYRDSTLTWSRQVRPIRADRNVWEKYLRRLCMTDDNLITTLGRWKSKPHQLWKFMKCDDDRSLLRYTEGVQKKMGMIGPKQYLKLGTIQIEPERGIPIQCTTTPIGYKEINTMMDVITSRSNYNIFKCDDKAINNTMGHVMSQEKNLLRQRWEAGDDWYMGTDGGLKSGIGSCGVTLHNRTLGKELCWAISAEKCGHGHLHSTREEVKAVVAAEAIIKECNDYFGYINQNIKFICDNKSALGKIKVEENKNITRDPLGSDVELLMELDTLRENNNNIERDFQWVKSHGDRDESHILSDHEKINQRADELATMGREYAETDLIPTCPKQLYSGAKVTLKIGGSVVSKNLKKTITMALYGDQIKKYLREKYDWSIETFDNIDWDAMEASLEKTQGLYKVSIYKLIHLWQPTNMVVQRNEKRAKETSLCTECGELDDQLHYMKCKSAYFIEARKYAWKRFNITMKKYKKEKTMIEIIWIGILNWIFEEFEGELPCGDELSEERYQALARAYHCQSEIGWDQFLVGRISKQWNTYYALGLNDDDEKNGKTLVFGRNMVNGIWKYTLCVWGSHNEKVHGRKSKYSTRDVRGIEKCITTIYTEFRNRISIEDQWLFREEVKIRLLQPVPQLIGWLERVLICLEEIPESDNVVQCAKRILTKMSISSIYD